MADIIENYRHLDSLDPGDLYVRYEDLRSRLTKLPDGNVDPNAPQDDETLKELCAILALLRRKSAGPPKAKRAPGKAPIPQTALEDL